MGEVANERKRISGIDHIRVDILCFGLVGRFLRWCGLLRIEYNLSMLGSPEHVGKLPPRLEAEINCDHDPEGERVIFDSWTGHPHMDRGWFVVHQSCRKCRCELGRWLQKDVVLGDGSSLREALEKPRRFGL